MVSVLDQRCMLEATKLRRIVTKKCLKISWFLDNWANGAYIISLTLTVQAETWKIIKAVVRFSNVNNFPQRGKTKTAFHAESINDMIIY